MSGELQTIPARHGVATFVPRDRTIKVINTYGKQVVSMWAFALGAPPEDDDEEKEGESQGLDEEQVQKEAEELKKAVEEGEDEKEASDSKGKEKSKDVEDMGKETQTTSKEDEKAKQDDDDPPEQAPDTPENKKTTEDTASSSKQPAKRTWASYLPSMPYRNKGAAGKAPTQQKPDAEEKAKIEENTKKWSSYLPTGKGYSSYVPSVQLPDSKEVVSAFKATHKRDPNKSYAEQLYDFSKTPVGAGTIAAATGSGYASSVYAVYSAYTSTNPFRADQPPMEYLSLPHTRAASHKLVPEVDDVLLTNLRNPLITLIEDTTPGAHDTLTAACDANLYAALGVDKPEEHGSCAVNLVLALKELNENAGLKGPKAVGADISVNIAPTPLHLFMNAALQLSDSTEEEGLGAKGATIKIKEPKSKKRSFVRFRAERDTVIVFSACPMDVGQQNGGRCMAANFMVEDVQEGEDLASSVASFGKKKGAAPRKISSSTKKSDTGGKKAEPKNETEDKKPEPKKEEAKKKPEPKKETDKKTPARRDSGTVKNASEKQQQQQSKQETTKKPAPKPSSPPKQDPPPKTPDPEPASPQPEDAKPKKKPKKLQVRNAGGGAATPTK